MLFKTVKKLKDLYNTTDKEVRWWAYSAWTSPFVALSVLFFTHIIGLENTFYQLLVVGGVLFFTVAVFWWWWAIFKVARISNVLLDTAEDLKKIGAEMREVHKELHQKDK